jgi:iron(III) transport system ATP-binding protein
MIRVRDVTKAYGYVQPLKSLSLDWSEDEVLGLVGQSGSGKSTLLRIIAGFLTPDSGTLSIDDVTVNDPEIVVPPNNRGVSMVFQSPELWPHMTVSENIRFTLLDKPRLMQDRRIEELLRVAGLSEHGARLPNQLSGGEARRVSILRALAPGRRYILMDEPLVNLDPELKADIHRLIRSETRGKGVLYVTHDEAELEGFAGRILHLRGGVVDG